jgi:hypothetical protein
MLKVPLFTILISTLFIACEQRESNDAPIQYHLSNKKNYLIGSEHSISRCPQPSTSCVEVVNKKINYFRRRAL